MRNYTKFYINGQWVAPHSEERLVVVNPATEEACGRIALGDQVDVDAAVSAARNAFKTWGRASREDRIGVLEAVLEVYRKRQADIAEAIQEEMGAPSYLANGPQSSFGDWHFTEALRVLRDFSFAETQGRHRVFKEPIGVCGLITPWNWPLNQIGCKVAPALAVGCTMVLKPSEVAPLSARIFCEILDEAGVPAGVFNLVNGDGPGVGTALSSHPEVDMVSFTGSTRAGTMVAANAAPTVKRVTQELGGKSPNIILADADLEKAVSIGVAQMMNNSGQSCNAPSRMLVPSELMPAVEDIAKKVCEKIVVGDPARETTTMGPVVSAAQYQKVQMLIEVGIAEGAKLVCGEKVSHRESLKGIT